MIPYGRQNISKEDINAVVEVLKSDFLTQGPLVPQFECEVSDLVGAEYGVAVNSATSALHLACLALAVGNGDSVWTTSISFVATANCAIYCGADVEFIDIDCDTYNISIPLLEEKLNYNKVHNIQLPKVVIVVHLAGQSCSMKEIHRLSKEFDFRVIEDASHAIGAKYDNGYVGSCLYSDISIFSFHPVKIITTAEGGLATTNCNLLYKKMQLLRSHGVTRDHELLRNKNSGDWYYEQIDLGFNYRMTELQAALGLSQLKRLNGIVEKRNEKARVYDEELKSLPIKLPFLIPESYSSHHLYIIQVNSNDHKKLFSFLRNNGVGVNLHYIPIYKHPYYEKKYGVFELVNSESYYKKSISIPLYYDLSKEDQTEVINIIKRYYDRD